MIPKDEALSEIPTAELRLFLDKLLKRQFDTEAAIQRVDAELRRRKKRLQARGQDTGNKPLGTKG